ncbi:hypothetical protein F2981_33225 (plasmid) [Sinorhizobium meliloti]|nr:hypothetical protein [Sinorhizobium meliloti]
MGMVFSLLRYNLGKMQKFVKFVKFVNIKHHPAKSAGEILFSTEDMTSSFPWGQGLLALKRQRP